MRELRQVVAARERRVDERAAPRRASWPTTARPSSSSSARSATPSTSAPSPLGERRRPTTRSPGRAATARRAPSRPTRARPATARPARSASFSSPRISRRGARRCAARHQLEVVALQRDRMVFGSLCGSVVARTKMTCGGGSSSVFSSALNAPRREHVDFVDDVDLLLAAHRRVADRLAQLADVVDAVVRRAVDLLHVDAVPAVISRHASHASHGVGRRRVVAGQRLGEDARRGGLADAARAGRTGTRGARGPRAIALRACA